MFLFSLMCWEMSIRSAATIAADIDVPVLPVKLSGEQSFGSVKLLGPAMGPAGATMSGLMRPGYRVLVADELIKSKRSSFLPLSISAGTIEISRSVLNGSFHRAGSRITGTSKDFVSGLFSK